MGNAVRYEIHLHGHLNQNLRLLCICSFYKEISLNHPQSKWPINSTPPKPDPNQIVPNRAKCRTQTSIGQFEKMAAVAPYRQLPHNLQMREPKCPT
jgi:hypothetical protein